MPRPVVRHFDTRTVTRTTLTRFAQRPPAGDDVAVRRKLVAVLLIAATLVTPVAVGALWLRLSLLNEDRYVHTVAPLVVEPGDRLGRRGPGRRHPPRAGRHELCRARARKLGPVLAAGVHQYIAQLVEKLSGPRSSRSSGGRRRCRATRRSWPRSRGKQEHVIQPDGSVEVNLASVVAAARDTLAADGAPRLRPGAAGARPGAVHDRPAGALHRARQRSAC